MAALSDRPLGRFAIEPKDMWNQQTFHVLLRGFLRFYVPGNSSPSYLVNHAPWSGDWLDGLERLPHLT